MSVIGVYLFLFQGPRKERFTTRPLLHWRAEFQRYDDDWRLFIPSGAAVSQHMFVIAPCGNISQSVWFLFSRFPPTPSLRCGLCFAMPGSRSQCKRGKKQPIQQDCFLLIAARSKPPTPPPAAHHGHRQVHSFGRPRQPWPIRLPVCPPPPPNPLPPSIRPPPPPPARRTERQTERN